MKKKVLLILPLLLLSLTSGTSVSGNFTVDATVEYAFYDDLDGDMEEDDVGVDLSITVSNYQVYTDVELYVGVELPSGQEFWFKWTFTLEKQTYSKTYYLETDLMDTALESGWYWAHAVGFAEGEDFSVMHSYQFDPPGSVEGTDPVGYLRVYN